MKFIEFQFLEPIKQYLQNMNQIITLFMNDFKEKIDAVYFDPDSWIIEAFGLLKYLMGDIVYGLFLALLAIGIALMVFRLLMTILTFTLDLISTISTLWEALWPL